MTAMPETRDLRLLATAHCVPYKCEAKIYIQDKHPSGYRHLVAQYGDGYAGRTDLPVADNGCREFAAALPHDMGEQEIIDRWLFVANEPARALCDVGSPGTRIRRRHPISLVGRREASVMDPSLDPNSQTSNGLNNTKWIARLRVRLNCWTKPHW
jgi:hypothetical protein